jgi:hypothetical protein
MPCNAQKHALHAPIVCLPGQGMPTALGVRAMQDEAKAPADSKAARSSRSAGNPAQSQDGRTASATDRVKRARQPAAVDTGAWVQLAASSH